MKWPRVAFKEVAEIITGSTPPMNNAANYGGNVPFVTPAYLDAGKPICKTETTISTAGVAVSRLLPVNAVLVSCIGSLGKVGIAGVELMTNQQINALVFDDTKINPLYGYHYCRTLKPILENMAPATTLPIVNKSRFSELTMPSPPLAEQKHIAAILDEADGLRRKRREAIAKLDSLLQSVFMDMFGEPTSNPKGWNVASLDDVATKITDGVHLKPNYTEDGVPFISVKDITTGRLRFDNCKFVSATDHQKMSRRCSPEFEDVLYTKVGATYGRPALVDQEREFSLYVSVCLIKPNRRKIVPQFLCEVLATDALKHQADKSIKGIGVPDLHLIEIKQFLLPLPPIDRQREYLAVVNRIRLEQQRMKRSLDSHETLFAALQHQTFNPSTDVTPENPLSPCLTLDF